MDVRNCKKCNKLFNYMGDAICPACSREMEEKFVTVRDYIRDNPGAPMSVVAEENDVPVQQLKKWVRQERLAFSKDSGISIDCEACGRPILTGRYCKECQRTMKDTFTSMYQEKPDEKRSVTDSKGKMRFLGN